jgi:hypothetical protein
MGWNDHEPAFSAIEMKVDELMDQAEDDGEPITRDQAYSEAVDWYVTRFD